MKSKLSALLSVLSPFFVLTVRSSADPTVDSLPPVVVKTVPEAGAKDVPSGITEIKITFSKDMADRSWSLCEPWQGANAAIIDGSLSALVP